MNKDFGIAPCGLACCVCSEEVRKNVTENCTGCESGKCSLAATCKSRGCSKEKGLKGCYECDTPCKEGVLDKVKVQGFIAFIKRYGVEKFMECIEKNENTGVVYHRNGVVGDYDQCKNVEAVIAMLLK